MNLGPLGSYPLPQSIREAYGVTTAQQLADQLGVDVTPTPDLIAAAQTAYADYRGGDVEAARVFLRSRLGMDDAAIDDALSKLPR